MPDPKRLISRLGELKTARSPWNALHDDAIRYSNPSRTLSSGIAEPGSTKTSQIYDSTAIYGNLTLAAGLFGALYTGKWFKFKTSDNVINEDYGVREHLAFLTEKMQAELLESNFGTQMLQLLMGLTSIGTACMYEEEGQDTTLNFSTKHISQFYHAENKDGIVDTVFREFTFKVRQAVQAFGLDTVGESIRKLFMKGSFEQEFSFLHAVYPREDYDTTRYDNTNMPYASVYVDLKDKKIVRESGYMRFPYMVPRWGKNPGELCGRSQTIRALSEIKMLNQMAYTIIRAGQLEVDKPISAPVSMEGQIDMNPSGVSFHEDGSTDRIEVIDRKSNFTIGQELKNESKELINNFYFVPQFLALSRITKQMTIPEVMERKLEGLRILSPILEPVQKELSDPLIKRSFDICKRKGVFGPIDENENLIDTPEALRGVSIEVEYTSSLAMALRMQEVQSFMQSMELVAPLFEGNENAMDNIDIDDAIRGTLERSGAPQSFIRNWDIVVEMRQAKQEAMQAAAQAERMEKAADITQKLSGKVDPSSPLKDMSDNPEQLAGVV